MYAIWSLARIAHLKGNQSLICSVRFVMAVFQRMDDPGKRDERHYLTMQPARFNHLTVHCCDRLILQHALVAPCIQKTLFGATIFHHEDSSINPRHEPALGLHYKDQTEGRLWGTRGILS